MSRTMSTRRPMALKPNVKAPSSRSCVPNDLVMSAHDESWMKALNKPIVEFLSTIADVERYSSDGSRACVQWAARVHDVRKNGADCVLGGLTYRVDYKVRILLVEDNRYLGILCSSNTTSFRAPIEKLHKHDDQTW